MKRKLQRFEVQKCDDTGEKGEAMDEKKKMKKLEELWEEAEERNDTEAAAALKWAIFQLMNRR